MVAYTAGGQRYDFSTRARIRCALTWTRYSDDKGPSRRGPKSRGRDEQMVIEDD
ncbi:hypothetical protein V1291_003933 [Nitrobacteraceae bacterium AZCC 1564]